MQFLIYQMLGNVDIEKITLLVRLCMNTHFHILLVKICKKFPEGKSVDTQ